MLLILLAGISYIVFRFDKKICAGHYLKLLICGFSVSYPVSVLTTCWIGENLLFGIQAVILVFMILFIFFSKTKWQEDSVVQILSAGSMALPLFPFLTSFYIELIHILNQRGIFVTHISDWYGLLSIALICSAGIIVFIRKKIGLKFENWKSWSYGWLIFGISCLSVQVPFQTVYGAHIYESANYSVLISDFLNFGSVPLVEHYGGHMLSSVLEGLIYAVLNNDFSGAAFSPYANYIVGLLAILFYIFVKYMSDEDMALWTTLLLPFYNFWSFFGIGMLVCVAVCAYIKKHTYSRAFAVWLSFVWCSLVRLDLGYAFGIACVASLVIYSLIEKDKKAGKQLTLSFMAVGMGGILIWFVLCLAKGIHPIERLLEFIKISASNTVWAYTGIGEAGNAVFSWCYLFVPFSIELALLYTVFSKKFREKIGVTRWAILLIFGISYFANFPRAVVRHSLVEMRVILIVWTGYMFLSAFASNFINKDLLFVPIFTVFMICSTLFLQNDNFSEVSIADQSVSKMEEFVELWSKSADDGSEDTYWEALKKNKTVVDRVVWDETLAAQVIPYQTVIDLLLDQDETFIDFMNRSFLYSGIQRKDPVYVVQSPLLLSDDFTQEMFIKEFANTPIVLMPAKESDLNTVLDGIANVYRYYKVSEFIYEHYQPLCSSGEFAVWCLNERYDEMKQKLENVKTKTYDEPWQWENVSANNCNIEENEDGGIIISSTGIDPFVDGLQNFLDLKSYEGLNMKLSVVYESSTEGVIQMYYASDEKFYTEEKSKCIEMTRSGIAEFILPVTKEMRLRMDISEESVVKLKSISTTLYFENLSWGYDGAVIAKDHAGNETLTYNGNFHNYNIAQLPFIWAEYDEKKAIENRRTAVLNNIDTCFVFDGSAVISDREKGNYLYFSADCVKEGSESKSEQEDELISAVVKLGTYEAGRFHEKYRYTMNLCEGMNSYLIRVSSDYYWYTDNINAVSLECGQTLSEIHLEILQGD